MKRYGHGWRKSPANARRSFGAPLIRAALASIPLAFSLEPKVLGVLDQLTTESCVPHAAAGCIGIVSNEAGASKSVSRLLMYAMGRVEGGQSPASLTDEGTIPSAMIDALARDGVCLEADWPFDLEQVNAIPPWDVLKRASGFRVTGWERLPEDASRTQVARQLIANGYPVMFGTPVDAAYEDPGGSLMCEGVTGDVLGGHMQCLIGYDGDRFRVLNSWGTSWRDGGFVWMRESWLQNPACSDFYALHAVPAGIS